MSRRAGLSGGSRSGVGRSGGGRRSPTASGARRRRTGGRRGCFGRAVRVLALLVLVALAAGGALAWWGWSTLHRPYRGFAGEETIVVIEPGTGAGAILERLEDEGVIADARLARAWLVYRLGDPPLGAGEYRFAEPATTPEVLDRLIRHDVFTHPVTLVEGLTLEETAGALAAAGFGERGALLAAMRDPAPVADLDPGAADLEGYLFPDTYAFARNVPEEEIVAAMVGNFRRRWEASVAPLIDGVRVEGAPAAPREVVTLASIVEKEARLPEERPLIAGVYANRLARGIALYADPTVIYAKKLQGTWDGNLRRPDLQLDSPYNTYRYPGLPPGPICSPGLAALRAAAAPAEVPYLYFVGRNDGSHVFAETLSEHNRNVDEWQRRYWQRRWAEEREQKR